MRLIDVQPVLDYSHNKNIRVCTVDLLEALPVVDAVPVVRCKDCAKRRTEECALYCGTEHFRGGREVMTWCGAMYNDEFGCVRGADMRRESEVKE